MKFVSCRWGIAEKAHPLPVPVLAAGDVDRRGVSAELRRGPREDGSQGAAKRSRSRVLYPGAVSLGLAMILGWNP